MDVAVRYRAAGDQNMVGGDFYDVFRTGDGVWTAIVGDVSGKGAQAAAVTALARYTLRAASRLHDDPAANLDLLNDALYEDASASRPSAPSSTPASARGGDGFDLRFANGGHPPPLLLRRDGTVETIEQGRGTLVGAIARPASRRRSSGWSPASCCCLYTDGVTEVRPGDLAFGERELRSTLAAQAGASAAQVVDAVERRPSPCRTAGRATTSRWSPWPASRREPTMSMRPTGGGASPRNETSFRDINERLEQGLEQVPAPARAARVRVRVRRPRLRGARLD